jgi:hypothetical protein
MSHTLLEIKLPPTLETRTACLCRRRVIVARASTATACTEQAAVTSGKSIRRSITAAAAATSGLSGGSSCRPTHRTTGIAGCCTVAARRAVRQGRCGESGG